MTHILAGSICDRLMFAIGGVMAKKQGLGAQDAKTVDGNLVAAADSLADTLRNLPDVDRYDLALVRVEGRERLERAATKVAGGLVVASVCGVAFERASIDPEAPSGEIVWAGLAEEILEADEPELLARADELRGPAARLTAALVAPAWAHLMVHGVPGRATVYDMDRAAGLARVLGGKDGMGFVQAHNRASVILAHAGKATAALAKVLLVSNSIPGKVATGIVEAEVGPQFSLMCDSLFGT